MMQTAFERDLIELKGSALGQAILHNGHNADLPKEIGEIAPNLKRVLEKV
jgi:hypothetical protein